MKHILFLLAIALTCCKSPEASKPERSLVGTWRVEKIVAGDSVVIDGERTDYNSVPDDGGSLFYRARELGAVIELGDNGKLSTRLVFTNFGNPVWVANENMDSLTLKLTNVEEASLIADGTVDKNGDLYLYWGRITFAADDRIDWTLWDGRTFRLKKEYDNQLTGIRH